MADNATPKMDVLYKIGQNGEVWVINIEARIPRVGHLVNAVKGHFPSLFENVDYNHITVRHGGVHQEAEDEELKFEGASNEKLKPTTRLREDNLYIIELPPTEDEGGPSHKRRKVEKAKLGDSLEDIVEWNERNHTPPRKNPEHSGNPMLNRDKAVELVAETAEDLVSAYNAGGSSDKLSYALLDAIKGSGLGKTSMGRFLYDHLRRMFEDEMPVKFLFLNFNGDRNLDTAMDMEFFLVKEADPAVQKKAEYSAKDARMALRLFGAITGTPVYAFLAAHKGKYELEVTMDDVFRFARKWWDVPDNKPVMVFVQMDEIQKLDQVLETATDDKPLKEFRKVRAPLTHYLFEGTFSRALEKHVIPVLMVSGLTAENLTDEKFSQPFPKVPVPLPRLREADFEVLFKWKLKEMKVEADDAAINDFLRREDVQQLVRDCAGHPRLIMMALQKFDPAWLESVNSGNVETWSNATLQKFYNYYAMSYSPSRAHKFIAQFGDSHLLVRKLVSGVVTRTWHRQWDECGVVWAVAHDDRRVNAPFFMLRALYVAMGAQACPALPQDLIGARLWYWQDFERAELYIDALRTVELRAGETEENRVCTVGDLYTGAIWSKSSEGGCWEVSLPERMVVKEEREQVSANTHDFAATVDEVQARNYKEMRQCAPGNPGIDSWTLRKSADGRRDVLCAKQSKHTAAQKPRAITKDELQTMVKKMTRATAKVASYRRVLLIFTNRGVNEDAVKWLRDECNAGADVCVGLIYARNLAEYVPPVMLERVRHADDRSGE